ncbi:membrane protein of unknown function [Beijerinckiaceae bacterium RH CH11]|nr:hypothetical protein [Beijerinckiaceae bacterium]VVB44069.1 membrane protein of unknown function [Beijerinckiaceae bacterium RH CH11]VVB44096.1 membrane protein of unknown function [Beijerinckiaceae bacterium RH AL8]
MKNADTVPPSSQGDKKTAARTIMAFYGGFFLIVFAGAVTLGIYKYASAHDAKSFGVYETIILAVGLVVALISIVLGGKVMLSDASPPKVVIPPEDRNLLEELIRAGNDKGIDQYVRLSSLSGTTGTATRLGLTGLPLATVGLTLFFAVGAIFKIEGYLDLTKLTVGAFIGSFVQRNVTGERIASEGIKILTQNLPPRAPPAGVATDQPQVPVNP